MNQEYQIREALLQAGEPTTISPSLLQLDGYRITTESHLKDEDFLFRLKGQPCLPRKDLTAITGQAKSGKTVLISMLMAACVKQQERRVLDIERIREEPLRVMWIDTEQSLQSTQGILRGRVWGLIQEGNETPPRPLGTPPLEGAGSLGFPEEMFYVFNIRAAMVEDRYELLATGVEHYHPDIVILDNTRDLVTDINDGVQAQKLTESLMKMAEENNCNVVAVLHQNRSADNRGLRGWLGTELMNKAFEMYTCQKILGKPGEKPTFCVEQSLTRKFDMDTPMYYQISDEGLPELCDTPRIQARDAQGKFTGYGKADIDTLNREFIIEHPDNPKQPWEWDLRKLFTTAIGNRATVSYQELTDIAMELGHIKRKPYFEKVFSMAEQAKVVRKDQDRCGRIVVMLLPL